MCEGSRFRILTVCTGNVCRSPLAESFLQAGFDFAAPGSFEVRSAGTHALVDQPMTPEIQALATSMGVGPEGFTSRQLVPDMLHSADLVLTLTREHSKLILEENPPPPQKNLLPARICRILIRQSNPRQTWSRLSDGVRQCDKPCGNGEKDFMKMEFDDIVDPYREPEEVLQKMTRAARSSHAGNCRMGDRGRIEPVKGGGAPMFFVKG